MANKIHVTPTSNAELCLQWKLTEVPFTGQIYIRCNSLGEVNWDKAPVYNHFEVILDPNKTIIKRKS